MRRAADHFERLATLFRPSWELDDEPLAGSGTLSGSDIRALQSSPSNAEVRAPVRVPNETPNPSKITATSATSEPAPPVFEPSLVSAATPGAVPSPALRVPQPHPPSRAHDSMRTPVVPPASGPALDAESSVSFALPSKRPLWIGAGVVVIILAVAGVLAMSRTQQKPAPAAEGTTRPVGNAKVFAIPPPPPEAATASPVPVAPAPALVPAAAVEATAAVTSAVPPPGAAHAAPAMQRAQSAHTPHAPPAVRKGPSIVRDVPF